MAVKSGSDTLRLSKAGRQRGGFAPRVSAARKGALGLSLAAAAVTGAMGVSTASAANIYWNGVDSNNTTLGWNDVGGWSTASGATTPNPVAVPGIGDIANFSISTVTSTAQFVDLNANQSALGLSFLATDTGGVTIQNGTGIDTLTIGASGISMAGGTGPVTISSALAFTGTEAWANSSASALSISGNISNSAASGTQTLTINNTGGGALTLSGAITDGTSALTALTLNSGATTSSNMTLSGSTSNTYSGTTTFYGNIPLGPYLYLSKTGGAVAIPGNMTIGNGSNGDQMYIRMTQNNQFNSTGSSVVTFLNLVGGYERFELQGTTQTLAGIIDSAGGGIIQNSENGVGGTSNLILDGSGTYGYAAYLRNGSAGLLSLTMNGTGTQTLSAAQIAYTGVTTLNSGTLVLQNATAYASPTTINSTATLQISDTSTTGPSSAGATINLNGGAMLFTTAAAGSTFSTLTGAVTVSAASTLNITNTAGSVGNSDLYFDGGFNGSAALTLTSSGGGYGLVLRHNNNDYSGTITVNGTASATPGTGSGLAVDGASTTLANANITVNGMLELGNISTSIGNSGSAMTSFNMNALAGSGFVVANQASASTMNFMVGNNGGTGNFTGVISNGSNDTLSFTKNGSGTQTLSGAAVNTYTGGTAVNGGTLLLDFSNLASPTNLINSASTLTLGGGTLSINGKSAGNTAQTLGNVTLTAGTESGITLTPNGAGSTTLTLGNTWTRGAGAELFINLSAAGTSVLASSPTLTGNLLPYALVQDSTATGFATVSGGDIVRFTGATTVLSATNSTAATTSIDFTTSGTLSLTNAATHATDSLQIASGGGGTLDLGGQAMTFTSGAMLMNGSGNYTIQNGQIGGANAELIVHQLGTGTLTFAGTVSSGTGSLTLDGGGTLALTGVNTYTGGTNLDAGTLSISSLADSGISNLGDSGTLTLGGGTLLFTGVGGATARTIAYTGPSTINVAGGYLALTGTGTGGGGITKTGSGTLQLDTTYSGSTDRLRIGTTVNDVGSLTVNGGAVNVTKTYVVFGEGGGATAQITINGAILYHNAASSGTYMANNVGANSILTVNGGAYDESSNFYEGAAAGYSNTVNLNSGTIIAGGSVFVANGGTSTAVWNQTAGLAYVGSQLQMGVGGGSSGTLNISGGSLLAPTSWIQNGIAGAGTINMSGSAYVNCYMYLQSNGVGNSVMNLSSGTFLATSSTSYIGYGSNGTAVWNQTGGTATFFTQINVANGTGPATLNISGGTFNDTAGGFYLGVGSSGIGTLNVSNNALVSINLLELGYQAGVTSNINFNGGTLRLFGEQYGLSSNGAANITFNGGTLQAGAGFTSPAAVNTYVGNGGAVIDTQSYAVTIAGPLTAAAGSTGGLTKYGAGTLTLSSTTGSTFAGATTLNGGTLLANFANMTTPTNLLPGGSALNLNAGSTLNITGQSSAVTSQTLGNLTLNNGGGTIVLTPGSSTSTTLTLGNTWTRNNNSTLLIDESAAGTSAVTSNPAASLNANGFIPWAAVKTGSAFGFASVSGGNIVPFAPAGGTLPGAGAGSTTDYALAGASASQTVTTSETANSVTVAPTAGGQTLTINNGQILGFTAGAVAFDGSAASYTVNGPGQFGASNTATIIAAYGPNALTINAPVSGGTGSVILADAGKTILAGANTYSGGTQLNGGTLSVGNAAALGTGLLTINGGTLDSNVSNLINANNNAENWNGNFTFAGSNNLNMGTGAVTLNNNIQITSAANTLSVGGAISGNYGLGLTGTTGSVVLSGTSANTYTGTTTVTGGALVLSKTAGLAAVPGNLSIGGTGYYGNVWETANNQFGGANTVISSTNTTASWAAFTLLGTTQTIGGLNCYTGGLLIGNTTLGSSTPSPSNSGMGTIVLTGAGNYYDNGWMQNAWGGGGGTIAVTVDLALLAAQTFVGGNFAYTGPTIINSGTLQLWSTSGFNSPITLNSGAALNLLGGSTTDTSASITFNGGTLNDTAYGYQTNEGALILATNATINITNISSSGSASLYIDGGLYGTGHTLTINNNGSVGTGVDIRNSTGSNFFGPVIVNGGQIGFSTSGNLALANADLTLNNAVLALGVSLTGQTATGGATIKSLNGNGTVSGAGSTVTLTVGANNGTGSFSGTLVNGAGGTLSLTKTGTGTQTLNGNVAGTYTGATSVNGGTLLLDFSNLSTGANLLSSSSQLSLGGGTLSIKGNPNINTSQTFASLAVMAGTTSSIVLTPQGGYTTTLTLGGATAPSGAFVNFNYSAGTTNGATVGNDIAIWSSLGLAAGTTIGGGYTVTDGGGTGPAYVNAGGDVLRLIDNGSSGLPVSVGSATTSYFVNASYDPTFTNPGNAGSLVEQLSGNVAANIVTVDTTGLTSGASLTMGANTLTLTSGGGITFLGANPYTITGSAGITTSGSNGAITFNNFNTSAAGVTISAPIVANGANSVTVNGNTNCTTVFSGTNTYTGGTYINGGILSVSTIADTVSSGIGIGTTGALSIGGGGTLLYTGAAAASSARPYYFTAGGATINVANPVGSLTLTSTAYRSGGAGGGLTKTGDGTLNFGYQLWIGNDSTETGPLTVSAGTFNATSTFVVVGNTAGVGTAVYTQTGGTFNNNTSGTLYVSNTANAPGSVNISGGVFNQNANVIWEGLRAPGSMTVSGTGVLNAANQFWVGYDVNGNGSGPSTLSLSNNAAINLIGGPYVIFGNGASSGTYTQTGGTFNIPNAGTITYVNNGTSASSMTISGGTYNSAGVLYDAVNGPGTVTLSNGTTVFSSSSEIGYNAAGVGVWNQSSGNSYWTGNGITYLGYNQAGATGTINMTGGTFNSAGTIYLGNGAGESGTVNFSAGTMTFAGTNANVIGNNGTGIWNQTGGAAFLYNSTYVGNGNNGTMSITNGSFYTIGSLVVGGGGGGTQTATLNIGPGAYVFPQALSIYGNGETGTINVTGGELYVAANQTNFGQTGGGISTFNQSAGTTILTNLTYVAIGTGTGTVNLSGGSFYDTAGSFNVGYGTGAATLNVSGSAFVSLNQLEVGFQAGANGTVNLNGGTLRLFNEAYGGGTAAFNFNGGNLQAGAAFSTPASISTTVNTGGASIDTQNYTLTVTTPLTAGTGSGGLTKYGAGTLVLNSTTGSTYAGATTLNGGTLSLNFTNMATPTNLLGSGSAVTMNAGATLSITGNATIATAQTLGNLTLNSGGGSIVLTPNGGPSTTLTLGNTWTNNNNSTFLIDESAAGTSTLTSNPSGSVNANGFIPWATVKTNAAFGFASVSGGNIVPYAGATNPLPGTASISSTDYSLAGGTAGAASQTVTASETADSLLIAPTAGGLSLTVNTGQILSLTTGAVAFNGGTAAYTIAGPGQFGGNNAPMILSTTGASALTISAPIGGGLSSLILGGNGKTIVSGINANTGGVQLNSGTLSLGNTNALGTGTFTINGGTLDSNVANLLNVNNNAQTWNGNFTFAGTNALNLGTGAVTLGNNVQITNTAGTLTEGGKISGGFGLAKTGTGVLVLTGSNTYTGNTTEFQGYLQLANPTGYAVSGNFVGNNVLSPKVYTTQNNQFAPGSVMSFVGVTGDHVRFELMGTTQTLAGIDNTASPGYGVIQNQEQAPIANTGYATLVLNGSGNYFFNGYLRDWPNAGSGTLGLTYNGTGMQVLSGGSITYSGRTVVNSGTLELYGTTAFNSATTVNTGAVLSLFGNNGTNTSAPLTLNGGTLSDIAYGYQTDEGPVILTANSTINVTNTGSSNNFFIDQGLYGNGVTLTINDSGSATTGVNFRDSTGTNFSGSVIVNGGSIGLGGGATGVLANADLTLNVPAIAYLNGLFSESATAVTVRSLNGNGTVNGNSGNVTFTVGANNGTGSFSGTLIGAMALTKIGSGTQTLTGALANTYTGATTVNGGTLFLDLTQVPTGILNSSSTLTLGGGTLAIQSGLANGSQTLGALTLNGGGLTLSNSGATNTLTLASISRTTGATLNVNLAAGTGANTVTFTSTAGITPSSTGVIGWATVTDGTATGFGALSGNNIVRFTGATTALPASGSVSTADYTTTPATDAGYSGGTLQLAAASSPGVNSLQIISGTSGTNSVLDLNGQMLPVTSGGVLMTGAGNYTIQNGQLGASASEVDINQLSTGTLTVSAPISGSGGSLGVGGGGTVILTGANVYTGTTTISTGSTLQIGTGGANGALAAGGAVSNGGTLIFNLNAATGWGNTITGAGALAVNGSGVLTLTGTASSYTGATTVAGGGTLFLNGNFSSFASNITANSGALVQINNTLPAVVGITLKDATLQLLTNTSTINSVTVNGTSAGSTIKVGNAINLVATNGLFGTNQNVTIDLTAGGANRFQWLGGVGNYSGTLTVSAGSGTQSFLDMQSSAVETALINTDLVLNGTGSTGVAYAGAGLDIANSATGNFEVRSLTGNAASSLTVDNRNRIIVLGTNNTNAGQTTIFSGDTWGNSTAYDSVGFVKNGPYTQELSGANINYNGTTTVNAGTFILNNTNNFHSPAVVNNGATINWTGTAAVNEAGGSFALNNGGTLEDTIPSSYLVLNGAVTNSGSTTIDLTSNTAVTGTTGFFLDSGLTGSGTVTINTTNAGSGIDLRNNNSSFAGTLIVNGIAGTTPFAGSGIGVGGCTTGLTYADITLNGTMELNNSGIGWTNTASGAFAMGALNGSTGVMVGNYSATNLTTTVTLGNTNNNGSFSGTIANGAGDNLAITKVGTATQEFSGANIIYGGVTTLSDGTLKLTNTTGFNGAGFALSTTTPVTLQLNPSSTWTLSKPINGGSVYATVAQIGAGKVTVGTAWTYTGATTIGNGILSLGHVATLMGLSAGAQSALTVQLDASDLTGGAITSWANPNSAGNFTGNATVQSGGAAFNGLDVVHFNGGQILDNPAVNSGNVSIFYVGALDGTQNARLVGGTANNWLMGYWSNKQDTAYGNSFYGTGGTTATVTATTATHLYETTISSTGAASLYSNGTLLGTGTGEATPNGLTLGGYSSGSGSEDSQGSIGEVLVFNTVLSTADRQLIESYLDYKWFGTGSYSSFESNLLPTGTAVSITGTGTLDLNSINQTIGSLSSATSSFVTLGSGTLTIGTDNTNTSFAGIISGTNGALTKTGTGTFLITGVNTYTGGTTVNGGTLQLGGAGTLGATSGPLAMTAGTLDLNGTSQAVGNFTGTGGTILNSNPSTVSTLTIGTGNATGGNFAGVIKDNAGTGGTVALTKVGTGIIELSGTNTYNGGTAIQNGTLQVGIANALPTGGTVTFGAVGTSGTLDLNGLSQQVGGLAVAAGATAAGQIIGNSGSAPAALVYNGGTSSFGGTIQNVIAPGSSTVSVTVAGGSLNLTGANTYGNGTSVIAGGTLLANTTGGGNSATGTGNVVVGTGGILGGKGQIGGNVIINNGSSQPTAGLIAPGTPFILPIATLTSSPYYGIAGATDANATTICGTLTIAGSLTLNGGSSAGGTYYWKVDPNVGGGNGTSDLLAIGGVLNVTTASSPVNIAIEDFGTSVATHVATYNIATTSSFAVNSGPIVPGVGNTTVLPAADFTVADNLNDTWTAQVYEPSAGVYDLQVTGTIPEPGSLGLLGVAAVGLLRRRRTNRGPCVNA